MFLAILSLFVYSRNEVPAPAKGHSQRPEVTQWYDVYYSNVVGKHTVYITSPSFLSLPSVLLTASRTIKVLL